MSKFCYQVVRPLGSVLLGLFLLAVVGAQPLASAEHPPGRVRNPSGRQFSTAVQYNPVRDDYLVGYTFGDGTGADPYSAGVAHIDTDGNFFDEITVHTNPGTNPPAEVDLAYDSNRNQFLFVWRNSSPATMFARFLDNNGNPIGSVFAVGTGNGPKLAFSPEGDRFAMTFGVGGGSTKYKVISPDHTLPNPVLITGTLLGNNAFVPRVTYGSVAQKFLFVYVKDHPAPKKSDVVGRFLSADGTSLGSEFGIDTSTNSQTSPEVGYTPAANRFIVAYETWQSSNPANMKVRLINPSGGLTREFQPATTPAWEIPGPPIWNESTQTVLFSWLHGSDAGSTTRAREWEVSDASASHVGDLIILSDQNQVTPPMSGAARPDPTDPQVMLLWKTGYGNDGIHAGVIGVEPPPPDLIAPAAVTDLSGTAGGPSIVIDPLIAFAASDEVTTKVKEYAVDGDLATHWATNTDTIEEDEFITLDLGANTFIHGVELWSRTAGNFFPLDYDIEVSLDGVSYAPVFSMASAVVPPGTSIQHTFSAAMARFVRFTFTRLRTTGTGKFRLQLAEIDVFEQDTTAGAITATWTAPGNDGDVGAASSYDLKWSLSDITDDADFAAATPVPNPPLPLPQLAGNLESFEITGLPDETAVFLAIKTSDAAGNVSDLSNVPSVNTPGIAPDPVDDLSASFEGADSARLTWSATADDGSVVASGPASAYDLRWHTEPVTETNFLSGNVVAVPFLPAAPNAGEVLVVDNLPPESEIYFGIRVLDELGNTSLADTTSTEPMVTTLDWQAPDTPFLELPSGGGMAAKVVAPAFDSSGDANTTRGLDKSTDGDPGTYWSSIARASQQDEFLSLDTGALHEIVQVKMLSRNSKSFFPQDVEVQTSLDDVTYDTVMAFTNLPATVSTWHTLDIPSTPARYVRILMTKTRKGGDGYYRAQVAEIEVYESPVALGQVTFEFDAPGDNGAVGTASSYDVRYSTVPITAANFGTSPQFATGQPLPGGSRESVSVTGLDAEMTYYLAMTASDGVNTSFISNILAASTPGVAPDRVSDLAVTGTIDSEAYLSWTATADDGSNPASGAADHYDIRISLAPITDGNFDAATPVTPVPPVPGVFGSSETHTITGLDDDTIYYIAIKVVDEVGNMSPIQSNGSVMAMTDDITGPGQVTSLAASAASVALTLASATAVDVSSELLSLTAMEFATDGNDDTFWNSDDVAVQQDEYITMDLGAAITFSRVRLLTSAWAQLFPQDLRVQVSNQIDTGFFTVHEAIGLSTTQGIWHELDFPAVAGRYVRIYINNTRKSGGNLFQARIAEIEVYASAASGAVNLMWLSPGDDPGVELRRATTSGSRMMRSRSRTSSMRHLSTVSLCPCRSV